MYIPNGKEQYRTINKSTCKRCKLCDYCNWYIYEANRQICQPNPYSIWTPIFYTKKYLKYRIRLFFYRIYVGFKHGIWRY